MEERRMQGNIRKAEPADLERLTQIYNYEVENGVATLDLHPKTIEERAEWLAAHNRENHPLYVYEEKEVLGYVSLSPYREKEAYKSTVELSIYIAPEARRKGVATKLMEFILKEAKADSRTQNVVSVITSGNVASTKLHERFGFTFCGCIPAVGEKFGKMLSIDNFSLLVEEKSARAAKIITDRDGKRCFPIRKAEAHKGNFGYVTIMAGSEAYSGAAKLSNLAVSALKVGCGVCRLAVSEKIAEGVMPYLLESTLFPMPSTKAGTIQYCPEAIDEALAGCKSAAVGMGWGNAEDHEKTLRYILQNKDIRLIIDADGLNTLSRMNLEILRESRCRILLTPHCKEFSRLSGYTIREIQERGDEIAGEFANRYGVIVLLKGLQDGNTLVTDGKECYWIQAGTPGMATAGSGDVLAGILAGMAGFQELSAHMAAVGAYLNGKAGEIAARKQGEYGMTAGDTVGCLPEAIRRIQESLEI